MQHRKGGVQSVDTQWNLPATENSAVRIPDASANAQCDDSRGPLCKAVCS